MEIILSNSSCSGFCRPQTKQQGLTIVTPVPGVAMVPLVFPALRLENTGGVRHE